MKDLNKMVITDKADSGKKGTSLYTSVVLLTIIWLGSIEKERRNRV